MSRFEIVTIRQVESSDLETFYEHQLDPEAIRMAAFVGKDPKDKAALDAHWDKILTRSAILTWIERMSTPLTPRMIGCRMVRSKSLFVATSSNVSQSKCVPWELGFSDGWSGKAAVLPILAHNVNAFNARNIWHLS